MKGYKILSKDMTSHGGFTWELGKKYTIDKPGNEMCSDQVFHYYSDPRLAVIFNPIHADYKDYRLFECEVGKQVNTDQLKFASKELTIVGEITIPKISVEQKVEFAIRCALATYKEEGFVKWANDWISGKDRSVWAAMDAEGFTRAAWAFENAARTAAMAARAARAARAERAGDATRAAMAARAARAAATMAASAAEIDFIEIIDKIKPL